MSVPLEVVSLSEPAPSGSLCTQKPARDQQPQASSPSKRPQWSPCVSILLHSTKQSTLGSGLCVAILFVPGLIGENQALERQCWSESSVGKRKSCDLWCLSGSEKESSDGKIAENRKVQAVAQVASRVIHKSSPPGISCLADGARRSPRALLSPLSLDTHKTAVHLSSKKAELGSFPRTWKSSPETSAPPGNTARTPLASIHG